MNTVWAILSHNFWIWSLLVYSAAKIALASAIVSLTDLALIQILPFMPTAISYGCSLANASKKGLLGLSIFLTRLSEHVNSIPSGPKTPSLPFLPSESTQTNSGSISLLAISNLANTISPICTSGRLRLLAPSKAR